MDLKKLSRLLGGVNKGLTVLESIVGPKKEDPTGDDPGLGIQLHRTKKKLKELNNELNQLLEKLLKQEKAKKQGKQTPFSNN